MCCLSFLFTSFDFSQTQDFSFMSFLGSDCILSFSFKSSLSDNLGFFFSNLTAFLLLLFCFDSGFSRSLLGNQLHLLLPYSFLFFFFCVAFFNRFLSKLRTKHLFDFNLLLYLNSFKCLFLHFNHRALWLSGLNIGR